MKFNILLLISFLVIADLSAQSTQYFRDLAMNHMTPRMEFKGLNPISIVTADKVAHYKFSFNEEGQLIELINSHPEARGQHPLSDIGAYKVRIDYEDQKEIRTYFDKSDNRIQNMRKVFKEVYAYDQNNFKYELNFFDENDKAISSSWDIAKYVWTKHGDKVIERRYDIAGKPQVLAPFFTLGTTAIEYGPNGLITKQYNVDEQFTPKAHSSGMVSYHDFHDQFGNVILISYRDLNGNLINAADGDFATILYIRGQFGNVLETIGLGDKGEMIWHTINHYDSYGNKIEFSN